MLTSPWKDRCLVFGGKGQACAEFRLPSADLLEKLAAYSLTLWGTRDGEYPKRALKATEQACRDRCVRELQRFACQLAGTGGGRGAASRSPSDAHDTDLEGATCRPIIVPFNDETMLRCLLHATKQFDLLYQALEALEKDEDDNEDDDDNEHDDDDEDEEEKPWVFYWWRDAAGKTMRREGPWAFGRAHEEKSRLCEPDLATWIAERETDDQKVSSCLSLQCHCSPYRAPADRSATSLCL